MTAVWLIEILQNRGIDFFCGVPDSLLKSFCDEVYGKYKDNATHHLIAHNEGGAVGYASGYHLATGKVPCVYLQNSGIGNITNPIASLTSPLVYGIPVLYIIGWRGQPNIADEPQHEFQGIITEAQLNTLDIALFRLTSETTENDLIQSLQNFGHLFEEGKSAALLVEKDTLSSGSSYDYENEWTITREAAVKHIVKLAETAIIVSSTGKISREIFEARTYMKGAHDYDFLTVGSMGHDAMIALGIAQQKPQKQVWSIQGDGAFLMHMGAAAVIGSVSPPNLRHIVLNNTAHESVGGMPTVGTSVNFCGIAESCGYKHIFRVETINELDSTVKKMIDKAGLSFLEIMCGISSRKDLGRPTVTPVENKKAFMRNIR